MGQQKNSGGGKKQQKKKKTDKTRRTPRGIAGAMQTAKNTKERLLAEAHEAEQKMQKLLARHEAGKPGGLEENSIRHRNLQVHIESLRFQAGAATSAHKETTDAAPDAVATEAPAAEETAETESATAG